MFSRPVRSRIQTVRSLFTPQLREHGIVLGVVLIKTWGTFVADDIIFGTQLPSILFTFYLLVSSAAIYSVIHTMQARSWAPLASQSRDHIQRLVVNGICVAVATLLWVYGVSQFRALRALLLDFADLSVLLYPVYRALDRRYEAHKLRGANVVLLGVGVTMASLLTSCSIDTSVATSTQPSRRHVCPTTGGALLGALSLVASFLLTFSRGRWAYKSSNMMQQTFNGYSIVIAAALVSPLGLLSLLTHRSPMDPPLLSLPILINCLLCALSTLLIPYFMEHITANHLRSLPLYKGVRLYFTMFVSLLLTFLRGDQQMNALVIPAFCLLAVGSSTAQDNGNPKLVVSPTLSRLTQPSALLRHPIAMELREVLSHARSRPESRRILWFLCASLAFMLVEVAVGLYSNSLGLMGDAGHMLFDNMALAIGLWAACMADRPPDARFPYGYHRFEVLAGFVNAIFLVFVAITIMVEAVERFSAPPDVGSPHLLPTAVAGFLINMGGLLIFGHLAHHHGCSHGHSHHHHPHHEHHEHKACGHQHKHGSGGLSCPPSPPRPMDCHADLLGPTALSHHPPHQPPPAAQALLQPFRNANLQGIFLHLLADALGSLSVITSSLLIRCYGWHIADPVCSVIVALLIMWSSGPLIMDSGAILLQRLPPELQAATHEALQRVRELEGVVDVTQVTCWQVPVDVVLALTVIVRGPDIDRQALLGAVRCVVFEHLKEDTTDLTVQFEQAGARRRGSSLGSACEQQQQQQQPIE